MKKTVVTALGLMLLACSQLAAEAQENYKIDYCTIAGDYGALYHGRIETVFMQNSWVAHPYWNDENFHEGAVCYDGVLYSHVLLRYNIFNNVLSVVAPVSKAIIAPDMSRIDYVEMEGMKMIPNQGWLDAIIFEGAHLQLLHHRIKTQSSDVVIEGHSYKDMKVEDTYLLRLPDGTISEVKNLRSLTALFPDLMNELNQLCRREKLRFKHAQQEYALRRCVEHIELKHVFLSTPSRTLVNAKPRQTYQLIPDSIYIDLPRVASVPAYILYVPGYQADEVGDDDDELLIENQGFSSLDPLRETRTLTEVEVVGLRQKMNQQVSGLESFRPSMLRNVPLAIGEADVLKLALTLPGVSSTGDASSGLNVRGGASDQNLLLLNGNTVFNPMHMFGLFSAFNPDLVSESELYKGGIPSQYGGRLSAVMNIKGRTADKEHFHGSASIGLVTAKGMIELPLMKNKVSLLLGGRTTYSDWMLKKLPKDSGYRNGEAGFWDFGGNLHTQFTPNQALVINGYYSSDRFAFTDKNRYEYRNMNYSAEMRSRWSNGLSTIITAGIDHYDYSNIDSESDYMGTKLTFDLNQYFIKALGNLTINDDHTLNLGVQTQNYQLMPGRLQPYGMLSYVIGRELDSQNAQESALWLEDKWNVSTALQLTAGVRLNYFNSQGSSSFNPDFRLSASYQIDGNQSVRAGLQSLHQYIHKVSNTVIMSPTDTWILSSDKIKPQEGWQLSGGYYWQSDDKVYECSAETYYKGMDNYLTYRSAAQLVMNPELHKDVVGTEGRAYGVELQLRKLTGKLNGWISYTYARTQLRQANTNNGSIINHGNWFNADYDSPHQIKLVSNFKFTRRYSMSLNADYSTGRPFTAPVGQFYDEQHQQMVPIYSQRNAYRMPDYCRVDWSFNVEPSHHLTNLTHSWFTIGVYNLLGRKNAYSIYYKCEGREIQGYKLSIFGAPIPYVSYNIKF